MTDAKQVVPRHSAVAFVIATLLRLGLGSALLLAGGLCGSSALARDIAVGQTHVVKVPSQAATVAADGDRVLIDPGTYTDCAIWRASRLTIEAAGPGVVIGHKICGMRGIFVTVGNDITVRGITFVGAESPYHTGAGIRGYGDNLTVEDSRFLDNENGILAGGTASSRLRVLGSEFRGNGSCDGACAHAIYAGAAFALLDVENCHFLETKVAHSVKSRARTTIVSGNRIEDGAAGTSSYLIDIPNGGNLLIQDNVLQKGPRSSNPAVAISIGEEDVTNPTQVMIIKGNRFANDLPEATIFVRNSATVAVALSGNLLRGKITPLQGTGSVEDATREEPPRVQR